VGFAPGSVLSDRWHAAPARLAPVAPARLVGLFALVTTAVIVWGLALAEAPYREVGDLGLVSVLPAWSYLAFVPLAAAMAWLVHRPSVPLVPAVGLTIVLIAILEGTSPLLSGEPRIAAAWRHLGVIDYLVRNGRVDPSVDVYHNWPGFFTLAATLAQAAGVTDLRGIALWAPVWQSMAYLPALYLLLTGLVGDRRVTWVAIWVFYAANWIGQDYLSPQALGFFLYLVVASLFVRWLAHRDARTEPVRDAPAWRRSAQAEDGEDAVEDAARARASAPDGPTPALAWFRRTRFVAAIGRGVPWLIDRLYATRPPAADTLPPSVRALLGAGIVVVYAYSVTAHQLTPFFMLAATTALLALLRLRWFMLVPLLLVMIAGWALFAAVPYLTGHIDQIAATSGGIGGGVEANLGERLGGSADHRLVVFARLVMTAAVWLLGGLGILRRLVTGHWDVTIVALAAAPFPLFALQSYGGEMLLRIALFSLPAMGVMVAYAVLPRAGAVSLLRTVAVFGLAMALMTTFLLTRYGNERLETFTAGEVAAVEVLYREAPAGSMLLAVSGNIPWKLTRYEAYRYRPSGDDSYFGHPDELLQTASEYSGPVYFIITRAQRAAAEMLGGAKPGAFDAFTAGLLATGSFETVYTNADAIVARYTGPASGQ